MKKGFVVFCSLCVLVFAAFTIKYAMNFAENIEGKQKQQIAQIEREIKELREIINAVTVKRLYSFKYLQLKIKQLIN